MQNIKNQVTNSTNQNQTVSAQQPAAFMQKPPITPAQPAYIPTQQQPSPLQSSGVNIVIYNPTVSPSAGTVTNSNNTYGMPMAYPQNYYVNQTQQPTPATTVAKAYLANSALKDDVKTSEEKPAEPEKKEETHKENIVQLTDDYIKTLENYLNNQNAKIREMGAKELFARFKEHKSRYNDIALTNLLNKALQDGSQNVRFVALTTLDAGYAQGDNLTKQILQKMQSSKAVYGEDAMLASEVLLKTAGNKIEIDVPGPKPSSNTATKKGK